MTLSNQRIDLILLTILLNKNHKLKTVASASFNGNRRCFFFFYLKSLKINSCCSFGWLVVCYWAKVIKKNNKIIVTLLINQMLLQHLVKCIIIRYIKLDFGPKHKEKDVCHETRSNFRCDQMIIKLDMPL